MLNRIGRHIERATGRWRWLLAAVIAVVFLVVTAVRDRRTHVQHAPPLPAAFPGVFPLRAAWAWETNEDLTSLSAQVGVAYLAETLILSDHVAVRPRRAALLTAPDARVMAVVRIEVGPHFVDTPALRNDTAARLSGVLRERPGVALQIDFDATESQRPFYAAVLRQLRPAMPQAEPLSITALVSWCGAHSWLHSLPIDEAVPMFFRMGGPRALAGQKSGRYGLSEPLCRSSVGVSTDEAWPDEDRTAQPQPGSGPETRLYVFSPQPWRPDQLRTLAAAPVASLQKELAR